MAQWGDGSDDKKEFLDGQSQRPVLCAGKCEVRTRKAKGCAGEGARTHGQGCVAEGAPQMGGLRDAHGGAWRWVPSPACPCREVGAQSRQFHPLLSLLLPVPCRLRSL